MIVHTADKWRFLGLNPGPEALAIRDWQFNAKNEPLLQVLTSVLLLGVGLPRNTSS